MSYHTVVDFHHIGVVGFSAFSDSETERGSPLFLNVLSADSRARAHPGAPAAVSACLPDHRVSRRTSSRLLRKSQDMLWNACVHRSDEAGYG